MNEACRLPDLPYDYGVLEPQIGGESTELHQNRHHAGYAKGANGALQRLADTRALAAWEHAYYVQYLNAKGDFFDAVWQVVNWANVAARLTASRRLDT